MVWAMAIMCVSFSCEPVPITAWWYFSADDCDVAAQMIMASWKPDVGFYSLSCFPRFVI